MKKLFGVVVLLAVYPSLFAASLTTADAAKVLCCRHSRLLSRTNRISAAPVRRSDPRGRMSRLFLLLCLVSGCSSASPRKAACKCNLA
jgi:hypothetical protein